MTSLLKLFEFQILSFGMFTDCQTLYTFNCVFFVRFVQHFTYTKKIAALHVIFSRHSATTNLCGKKCLKKHSKKNNEEATATGNFFELNYKNPKSQVALQKTFHTL